MCEHVRILLSGPPSPAVQESVRTPDDEGHSEYEHRYYAIGLLPRSGKIIKVNYTMRGEKYRLITARKATAAERQQYAEHLKLILGI